MSPCRPGPMPTSLRSALLVLLAAAPSIGARQTTAAPAAHAGTPVLIARADGEERGAPLQIGSADVQVAIAGFLARTTTTLTFENTTPRTLESELVFPLPEGASISGYGLDVEGHRGRLPRRARRAVEVHLPRPAREDDVSTYSGEPGFSSSHQVARRLYFPV